MDIEMIWMKTGRRVSKSHWEYPIVGYLSENAERRQRNRRGFQVTFSTRRVVYDGHSITVMNLRGRGSER